MAETKTATDVVIPGLKYTTTVMEKVEVALPTLKFVALAEVKKVTEQFEDGAITYSEWVNKVYSITARVINAMDTEYLVSVLQLRAMDARF